VLKEPAGDDADGGRETSAEHIAPNLVHSNLLGQTHPLVIDRVKVTAPSVGGQKRKRPLPALKRKQSKPPAEQVMTQIELPPYHRPQSPLSLVVVEIVFGRLFEAFRHESQAAGAGTSAGGAAQPVKKTCRPLLLVTTPTVLPAATAPVPPPLRGTSLAIRCTIEAWDSARCLAEYLEGLKNAEADREGTHFPFTISSL
jgi:hypothetical protein